jgi:hypothetical protein
VEYLQCSRAPALSPKAFFNPAKRHALAAPNRSRPNPKVYTH